MEIIRKHFDTIDSTNTWGKHNAHLLQRDAITLVTASGQTGGRGRFKRLWVSPPDVNIYATYCFFVEKHRTDIGNLPQVMAIAAAELLIRLGFSPKLKWPNDILLSEKKASGILCETTALSDSLCVVLGIGLNVNMAPELLATIDRPATSLIAEDGKRRDVEEVLNGLTGSFVERLDLFMERGFLPFLARYKELLQHKQGDNIRFHDNQTIREGVFHAIADDGSLNLQLPSGLVKNFIAGEIL